MGGLAHGVTAVMAEQCTGRGRRGVVVAAAPIAAGIGVEVLRAGGNAFDAATAALLAETVLLPPKCGLAGDLVALRLDPGAPEPVALLAIGPAPRKLGDAVRKLGTLADTGPLSVGVPGAPAGYAALAALGRFPLEVLAAPAISLAHEGVPWSPICTVLGEESAALVARHNGPTRYYPDGRPPEPGQLVQLPGLAAALEELVAQGAGLFAGPVGAAVVARVSAAGGVLTADDLLAARAEWLPAVRATVGGWDLWATPGPTHGPALLDALVTMGGPVDAGVTLTAVRRAAARRKASLADPLVAAGTSMVSAVDADGEVVVVIHSNSYPRFGSGLVVDEYDLILANRAGRGFSADPAHPNFPAPGRRPATTLHAWAAGRARSAPSHLGGTPGGVNQMPWNAQSLRDLLAGCEDPGALVVAPKWEWLPEEELVRAEVPTTSEDRAALAEVTSVVDVDAWDLRSAQQVVCRPRPGEVVVGAVDPRTGGLALGA